MSLARHRTQMRKHMHETRKRAAEDAHAHVCPSLIVFKACCLTAGSMPSAIQALTKHQPSKLQAPPKSIQAHARSTMQILQNPRKTSTERCFELPFCNMKSRTCPWAARFLEFYMGGQVLSFSKNHTGMVQKSIPETRACLTQTGASARNTLSGPSPRAQGLRGVLWTGDMAKRSTHTLFFRRL